MMTRTMRAVCLVWAVWAAGLAGAGGCVDIDMQPDRTREKTLRADLERTRTELAAADRLATMNQAQLERANQETQRLTAENQKLTGEREALRETLAQERSQASLADGKVKDMAAAEKKLQEKIARLEEDNRARTAAMEDSLAKREALQGEVSRLKDELAKLQQRLESALSAGVPASRPGSPR